MAKRELIFFSFYCLQICGDGDGGLGDVDYKFHNSTIIKKSLQIYD
jgi:hypothetical protein